MTVEEAVLAHDKALWVFLHCGWPKHPFAYRDLYVAEFMLEEALRR